MTLDSPRTHPDHTSRTETDTAITTTEQAHATFEPDAQSVAEARRFIRRTLISWGAASVVDDAVLLASEFVTNAIVHAGTRTEIICSRYENGIQVDVVDQYPARELPAGVAEADPQREGGRGLHLSSLLAAAWGVEYSKRSKRVWFRLETRATSPEAQVSVPPWPDPQPTTGMSAEEVRVACVLLDPAGRVCSWNADAVALFGWNADQVTGSPLGELVAWPHQPGATDSFEDAVTVPRWQGVYGVRDCAERVVEVFASHVVLTDGGQRTGTVCLLVPQSHRALLEARGGHDRGTADPAGLEREWASLVEPGAVSLGMEEMLRRVVERLRDGIGGDAAFVMLATDEEAELEIRATTGLPPSLQRFARLPIEGLAGRVVSPRLPTVHSDIGEDAAAAPYLRGSGMRALLTVPLLVEGRVTGVIGVVSATPGRFDNEDALRLQAAGERIALSVESARLAELYRVRRGWLSFLAEASDLLASTLDPRMTMAMVAQLVVPRLATWCAVWAMDERAPSLDYVWHSDEGRIDALRVLLEKAPLPEHGTDAGARLWPGLSEVPAAALDLPDADEMVDDVVVTLPMVARGHNLGLLMLGRASGDRFRRDVLDLAEDLSRRAAFALDNARLYAERSATSQALQRSLLPPELPEVPGLDVGVIYEAAGESNEVGGDFYDLFTIGPQRWGFAIGDVCGTGAEAAAVTGLARHTLRVLSTAGYTVPASLERLNAAILDEGPRARFLTLLYGEITPRPEGGLRLTLASAGHPLPVRLRADGRAELVGNSQPLLGVMDNLGLTTDTVDLDSGDVLVCVTDGVTERRNGAEMIEDSGLLEVVARCEAMDASTVAGCVQQAVQEFAPEPSRDDMAILVLRAR